MTLFAGEDFMVLSLTLVSKVPNSWVWVSGGVDCVLTACALIDL